MCYVPQILQSSISKMSLNRDANEFVPSKSTMNSVLNVSAPAFVPGQTHVPVVHQHFYPSYGYHEPLSFESSFGNGYTLYPIAPTDYVHNSRPIFYNQPQHPPQERRIISNPSTAVDKSVQAPAKSVAQPCMLLSLSGACDDSACQAQHSVCLDDLWETCNTSCGLVHIDSEMKVAYRRAHPATKWDHMKLLRERKLKKTAKQ